MRGEPKLKMLNLEKWNSQANESVRHRLAKATTRGLPCVAYCLVYMDYKGDHIEWMFENQMAFDPDKPPDEEERKKIEAIMDGYAKLAQKLMSAGVEDRRDQ